MNYPSEYKYTKDHEWVHIEGDKGTTGITHHAQEQLGDVVFVELPEVGKKLEKGDVFGVVESVKAVVDCYMPVSGTITARNDALESQPELINSNPHDNGWMIQFTIENDSELSDLMDAEAYKAFLEESDG